MKIKCVITDDEPLARKGLEKYVQQIDFLEHVASFEDALQLSEVLSDRTVDLIFLDINMPHLSGIDFLRMPQQNLPKVILSTAYPEFAIEGYELDILDYLLKPISFERFYKSAVKAKAFFELTQNNTTSDYFFLKCEKRLEKIVFEEICFIESMQNYVKFFLENETLLAHTTLKSVLAQLPNNQFIQPHKSYIIAIEKIKAIEGNQIIIGPHKIPISKYQKETVLRKILK